jgi:DNA-binding MarR family transcriptional regulator
VCADFDIPAEVGERGLSELTEAGLVTVAASADGAPPVRTITPEGEMIVERLVTERRASLARLCEGWAPEQNADLAGLLTRLAHELAREPSHEVGAPA